MGGTCSRYGEGRREVNTRFWWEILKERDKLEDLSVDGRILLKWTFKKWDGAWIGSGS
jgi:hypothetical protein